MPTNRCTLPFFLLASMPMTASGTGVAVAQPITSPVSIGSPEITDGPALRDLAAASKVLDVNSRYAYLLWCRDFAGTSVVARSQGRVVGFVTGYRRPDEPGTLMVWQVAVDAAARGLGVAGRMLDALVDAVPDVEHLETTITPGNSGSVALFTGFARRRAAAVSRTELFGSDLLGEEHEPELLFRIGPIHSRRQCSDQ